MVTGIPDLLLAAARILSVMFLDSAYPRAIEPEKSCVMDSVTMVDAIIDETDETKKIRALFLLAALRPIMVCMLWR